MTSIALTFLEGLAAFLSPCTLPMIPVYAAYFSGGEGRRAPTLARALAFVLAFALLFVAMGAFAGSVGRLLSAHRMAVRIACGGLMVALGLGYLGLFRLPFAGGGRARPITGIVSAFLFGLAFALSLTPCVGAFLASALLQAAAEGTVLRGTLLLLAYSVGLGIPFVLSALLIQHLKGAFSIIKAHYGTINAICGGLLIASGVVLAAGELTGKTFLHNTTEKAKEVKMEITLTAENFETEVLKSDKPVLVDFWATWCGPCRMLGPVIAEIAEEQKEVLKVGKVNVDECPELAAKYGVMSIPAVFLFRHGQVAAQAVGYMPKAALLSALNF